MELLAHTGLWDTLGHRDAASALGAADYPADLVLLLLWGRGGFLYDPDAQPLIAPEDLA